jgi:hypothetical protein
MLRTRIEAKLDAETGAGRAQTQSHLDLGKLLQLVKDADFLLREVAAKSESARFLEEFITIINGTAGSVGEIQGEIGELIPMAEAALAEMQDTIASVSTTLTVSTKEETEAPIVVQATQLTVTSSAEQCGHPAGDTSAGKSQHPEAQEANEEQLEVAA